MIKCSGRTQLMDKTSLGDRMKKYYEARARTYLARRTPVIMRLDGKAFHTLTRSFQKPFDENLSSWMTKTACEHHPSSLTKHKYPIKQEVPLRAEAAKDIGGQPFAAPSGPPSRMSDQPGDQRIALG